MSPGHLALWLPSALLLLQVPGCLLLTGPRTVNGTVGGSLSVQCQYEERYEKHGKYWFRDSVLLYGKIVETTASSREARKGRVTIRDHPANLSFTVTLENLTLQDAGSYWCGINVPWRQDPDFELKVSVLPGEPLPLRVRNSSKIPGTRAPSSEDAHCHCVPCRCLFSSIHFLLLVFLKVPLFLSMLSAILWVNRPQRGSARRPSHPEYENQ
uniref:Ig-like domain-containing protein n=1 Tax=Cavia porcellus TaxID=10141 RepID=H0VF11_CAVPO